MKAIFITLQYLLLKSYICEFWSVMKIVIVYVCIPIVFSGYHSLITTYTGIRGATETPEFIAVTMLDGEEIDYYDSDIRTLIPKKDWMKEYASEDMWREDTEIRQEVHQIYRSNTAVLMQRFNQTSGVHVYQRMYGCDWDEEAEESGGIDQYGYDGEDYVMLDMKEFSYITPVQQGMITVQKWNNDRTQLQHLQKYYKYECFYWLKQFLGWKKADLETRAPEVFLLQKSQSSPVECFATGFYPSRVTITWLRNGQEHNENVHLGELLPNEDGTFQRSHTLNVFPDDWKKNQYTCVVEHQGETIQKTKDKIKSNSASEIYPSLVFVMMAIILLVVICPSVWLFVRLKKDYIAVKRHLQPVYLSEEGYMYKNE